MTLLLLLRPRGIDVGTGEPPCDLGNLPVLADDALGISTLADGTLVMNVLADGLLASSFPSTPILDTFNRPDEVDVTGWVESGLRVVSNRLVTIDAAGRTGYWAQAMAGRDVEDYITISTAATSLYTLLCARFDPGTFSG